jgi:hypothetical protein
METILSKKLKELQKLVKEKISKEYDIHDIRKLKDKNLEIATEQYKKDIDDKKKQIVETEKKLNLEKLENANKINKTSLENYKKFEQFLDSCSSEFKWSSNLLGNIFSDGNTSSNNFCTVPVTVPVSVPVTVPVSVPVTVPVSVPVKAN